MSKKCGFIAIIGSPNSGKSTLLNRYVGAKISIVSKKVQTTRTKITGITMVNKTQLIFIDTPGIFTPKKRLDKAMVSAAWQGADNADCILLLIDAAYTNYNAMASRLGRKTVSISRHLEENGKFTLPNISDIEKIIEDMLKEGDLFENLPGKVRVLE